MGIIQYVGDFFSGANLERKDGTPFNYSTTTAVRRSDAEIEADLRSQAEGDRRFAVSGVFICARIIAEGLALPPCYVHLAAKGGKTAAIGHPLYNLLNASPNIRQTSYEFREQIAYHLAIHSNAYIFISRSKATGEVLALMPVEPGNVTVLNTNTGEIGAPLQYYLFGIPVPATDIWHIKGPSWNSWEGMSIVAEAQSAIALAQASERYGQNLFINGARPGGILSPQAVLAPDQAAQVREMWSLQAKGLQNAHKTILLNQPVDYKAISGTANEAQWTESRRYQLEEICRYFRVSPTKAFLQIGSQSYASVEQAHIAHDADTDAHWHARFTQSANKALLTDKERRHGYTITIDNRAILRGTAVERMDYYADGIQNGIFTRNEAREMEGFDRLTDPDADKLTPAVNLYGPKVTPVTAAAPEPKDTSAS